MPILLSIAFSFLPSVSFAGEKTPPTSPLTRPDGPPPAKRIKVDGDDVTPGSAQSGRDTRPETLALSFENRENRGSSELEAATPITALPFTRKKSPSPRREAGSSDEHSHSPLSPTTIAKDIATPETPQDAEEPHDITTVQVTGSQPESSIPEKPPEMPVVLNNEGIRRIMLHALFPEVIRNITEDTSGKPDADVIKTHANIPLHQISVILKYLSLFNTEFELDANEIKTLIIPLKALFLLINTILDTDDVAGLKELYSLDYKTFSETAISVAGLDHAKQDEPLSLEMVANTLGEKAFRSEELEPYKLELSLENLALMATRKEQQKALLNEIEILDETSIHVDYEKLVEAHERNSVSATKGDEPSTVQWAESDTLPSTENGISILAQDGITRVEIPLLSSYFAEPTVEALLYRLTFNVFERDPDDPENALNLQLAKFLWDGVHLSKPLTQKNDETMFVMAQLLSILVQRTPYLARRGIVDEGRIGSHTVEDLAKAISEGSSASTSLLGQEHLPTNHTFDESKEDEDLKLQIHHSGKNSALSKLEEDVLSGHDDLLSLVTPPVTAPVLSGTPQSDSDDKPRTPQSDSGDMPGNDQRVHDTTSYRSQDPLLSEDSEEEGEREGKRKREGDEEQED